MATHITIPAHLNALLDDEMIFLDGLIPKSKEALIERIYKMDTHMIPYVLIDSFFVNNYFAKNYSADYEELYDTTSMLLSNMIRFMYSPIQFMDGTSRIFVKNKYNKEILVKKLEIYFSYPKHFREQILFPNFLSLQKEKSKDYYNIIDWSLGIEKITGIYDDDEQARNDAIIERRKLLLKHDIKTIKEKSLNVEYTAQLIRLIYNNESYALVKIIITPEQHTKIISINTTTNKIYKFSLSEFENMKVDFKNEISMGIFNNTVYKKACSTIFKEKYKGYSIYKFYCNDYDKLIASIKYFKDYIHLIKEKDNSYSAFGVESDIKAFLKFIEIIEYEKIK